MEENYVVKLLEKGERVDGRGLEDFRSVEVEKGIVERAEGSARVKMGKTDIVVGVKMDFGTPFPDVPDQGVLMVNAELAPIASPEFESGRPDEDTVELARVVDRGIRESKAIDLEKLCLEEGEKVWMVMIDIFPINYDGNLIDASALGAINALSVAKLPKIKDDAIVREELVKKLPLLHRPITVTVGKALGKFLIDPTAEEEKILESKLSVSVMEDGRICAMQKSGERSFSIDEINKCVDLAIKKSEELRKFL